MCSTHTKFNFLKYHTEISIKASSMYITISILIAVYRSVKKYKTVQEIKIFTDSCFDAKSLLFKNNCFL